MEPLKNMIEEKKVERNLDKRNPFKPTQQEHLLEPHGLHYWLAPLAIV